MDAVSPSKFHLMKNSFKKAWEISPSLLKDLTLKFGLYYFVLAFLFFLFLSQKIIPSMITVIPIFLAMCFIAFLVPYYTYKKVFASASVPDFWTFISKTLVRVVLTQIKTFFVIFFFTLLLIIPGFYKWFRLYFLKESVFFDSGTFQTAFKKSDQTTRGFFWWIVLFFILTSILIRLSFIFGGSFQSFLPSFLTSFLVIVLHFYLSCFVIMWKTLFYFEIKAFKDEPISL